MPGFVGLIFIILVLAVAALAFAAVYWVAGLVSKERGTRLSIGVVVALVLGGLLYWDYARLSETSISEEEVRTEIEPALALGAKYEKGYYFAEDLSSGTYLRLSMEEPQFNELLSSSRHEPSDWGLSVTSNRNGQRWGPDWADNVECPEMRSYQPDYRIDSSRPIDGYEFHYCPQSEKLYLTFIRI